MQSLLFSKVDLSGTEFIESNLMNAMFNLNFGIPSTFAKSVLTRCYVRGTDFPFLSIEFLGMDMSTSDVTAVNFFGASLCLTVLPRNLQVRQFELKEK